MPHGVLPSMELVSKNPVNITLKLPYDWEKGTTLPAPKYYVLLIPGLIPLG
jgi:hypothetical protein